jgi:AcrR family transcriptional regulator
MTMTTTGPRAAVREAILDAADRRLARYGYKKMTVDELATDAGIGKGTIYLHFRSKEEVVLCHVDRIVERMLVGLEALAQRDQPAGKKLFAMLVHRVLFRFDAVQHYTESLNDVLAAVRPALLQRRAAHFESEAAVLVRALHDGRKAGELECRSPADTARAMIEATNALLPYNLSPQELGDRQNVERRATLIAQLLVRGVSA